VDVAAAILAGGRARRMGGAVKPALTIAGVPILRRQLDVLEQLFSTIVISANDPEPFAHTGLAVVSDELADRGPLAGIAAAFAACDHAYLFIVAGDMPHIDVASISLLIDKRAAGVDVVAPYIDQRPEPLYALYSRRCLPTIERCLADGRNRVSGLFAAAELNVVAVGGSEFSDPALTFLTNINSPRDLP
jgi:molybdopterin-guanine dinucleotide biosynthesis protein A